MLGVRPRGRLHIHKTMAKTLTSEQLQAYYERTQERQKRYKAKRAETHQTVTLEITRLQAHTLGVLAEQSGISKGRWLGNLLDSKAEKHGITLPEPAAEPVPVSQVVTTPPTTSKTLQELADNWDTME